MTQKFFLTSGTILMNSANKNDLEHYLAEKFADFDSSNPSIPTLVCTHSNSILTNSTTLQNQSEIINCVSEEANQRILSLTINCTKNAC